MRPELGRELPSDWRGEGAEGAAIAALADWLREGDAESVLPAGQSVSLRENTDSILEGQPSALPLNELASGASTAAMTQHFQGTEHEAALAAAQADVMQWGDDFDVQAEFAGALGNLRKELHQAEIDALHVKMQGKGTSALNEQERARYLLLLQR
jgi:hypothetical protein